MLYTSFAAFKVKLFLRVDNNRNLFEIVLYLREKLSFKFKDGPVYVPKYVYLFVELTFSFLNSKFK